MCGSAVVHSQALGRDPGSNSHAPSITSCQLLQFTENNPVIELDFFLCVDLLVS